MERGHFPKDFIIFGTASVEEGDDFGNILGLIADSLHIRNHFQRRGDLPQVAGYRLLLEQKLQAKRFDGSFLLVDLRVQMALRTAASDVSLSVSAREAREITSSQRAPI